MRRGVHWDDGWQQRRGQSNVIAVVLLAGLVVAGATTVIIAGTAAIDEGRGDSSTAAAVQSMQSLDAKIQQIDQESSSQSNIDIGDKESDFNLVSESPADPAEAGNISISVTDPSTGTTTTEDFWLGTAKYERGEEAVAYQGGGVWRKSGNGSVAVSSPGISYRSMESPGTLNFPIVSLRGESTGSEFQIESVERKQLLSTLGLSNPIEPGTSITVEIRSEFYHGWAAELKSELDSNSVSTDPTTKTVTVKLKAPTSSNAPSAVLGTNDAGGLTISNFGATDSYNSTTGPYSTFPENNNADVLTKGAVKPSNKMSIRGDLVAESGLDGITTLSNKIEVYGRTVFGDDPDIGSGDNLEIAGNDQTFRGTFSTQDNVKISKPTEFNDDLLVGGNFRIVGNNNPKIDGRLVVTGNIEKIGKAEIGDDVYVHGDATSIASRGTVDIDGDLVVYGEVDIKSDADIAGTIYYQEGATVNIDSGASYGDKKELDTSAMNSKLDEAPTPIVPNVPSRSSAETEIDSWSSLSTSSNNDNHKENVIDSNDKLDFGATTDHTLESGEYYLERLNVPDGETLTLDTSSGGVVIYLPDNPSQSAMRVAGQIEVTGESPDNRARIYIDDSSTRDSTREIEVTGDEHSANGQVVVPKDKSANMWVYLKPTADVDFNSHAVYQGVIYGASDGTPGGATIQVNNHAQVYGALIGDVAKVPNHAQVHYDEALADKNAFTTSSNVAPVDFVQFSEQTTTVED